MLVFGTASAIYSFEYGYFGLGSSLRETGMFAGIASITQSFLEIAAVAAWVSEPAPHRARRRAGGGFRIATFPIIVLRSVLGRPHLVDVARRLPRKRDESSATSPEKVEQHGNVHFIAQRR
jgi:hypothetical protein